MLGGRVRYAQPRHGFRTGIEPVLLAASIPAQPGQTVLETGTGAGAALLCLAHRVPGLAGVGIERDPAMADLARQNLLANAAPFTVLTADIAQARSLAPALPPVDHAFANPPWHDPASSRPPDARRAAATHRAAAGLAPWVEALAAMLTPGGTLTLALPAALVAEALALLTRAALAQQTLVPLHPRLGQPPKLVLLHAKRGAARFHTTPGLVLHDGAGYSAKADAILRYGAPLSLEGAATPGQPCDKTRALPRPLPLHRTENLMSDDFDGPRPGVDDGTGGRHQHARTLAEQAMRAQAEGDDDRADELFAEASKIDPEAVANALSDAAADPADSATGTDAGPQDDEEIAAMSRTVQPGADAPSRSGISGRGSGADDEGS